MRTIAAPLILAAALAGTAASAQPTDPYAGYGATPPAGRGYGQQGYLPPDYGGEQGEGYGDQAPPGYGNAPPALGGTTYRDDERYGFQESYGSADCRTDAGSDPSSGWQDRGGPRLGYEPGRQSPRTRAYAGRVARWRARADACEAGDLRACQGPD